MADQNNPDEGSRILDIRDHYLEKRKFSLSLSANTSSNVTAGLVTSTGKGVMTVTTYTINDSAAHADDIIWSSEKLIDATHAPSMFTGNNPNITPPTDRPQQVGVIYYDEDGTAWVWKPSQNLYIESSVIEANKMDNLPTGTTGVIPLTETDGQLSISSNFKIDDTSAASATILWTSNKIDTELNSKQDLVSSAVAGDLAALDATGQTTDSGLKINDASAASATILWTSDKINTELNSKQNLVSSAVSGDLAALDSTGQTTDSGVKIDDTSAASATVLWTSNKIDTELNSKQDLVSSAVAGDLAALDATGQTTDSGVKIDDTSAASATILWTSNKIDTELNSKQDLVSSAVAGDLAALDATGQTTDSGVKIDDTSAASATVLWTSNKIDTELNSKQDLVSSAVAGDLAALDATGQTTDSGVKIDDTSAASATVLWTSNKIDTELNSKQDLVSAAVAGDLAALDATGQTTDSGVKIDDASAASATILWTSDKIDTELSSKQDLVSTAVAGDLAALDATGQTTDSGVKIDDASAASATVLWTSTKLASVRHFSRTRWAAIVGTDTTIAAGTHWKLHNILTDTFIQAQNSDVIGALSVDANLRILIPWLGSPMVQHVGVHCEFLTHLYDVPGVLLEVRRFNDNSAVIEVPLKIDNVAASNTTSSMMLCSVPENPLVVSGFYVTINNKSADVITIKANTTLSLFVFTHYINPVYP